jgi:hypothetical protein
MGRCKMTNKHRPIGPALLCERIARAISSETGVWFGSMDIANALARAVAGKRLAYHLPVSMMLALSSGNNGLRTTPNCLAEVARLLNWWGDTNQVTEGIVHNALVEVMRQIVGVIVVTVSPPKGELSIEWATSLAELMKRRAVARAKEAARLGARQPASATPGTQAERRAA